MAKYVPRVLVCGDVEAFRKKIDRPAEVVGQIDFKEKNFTAEDIKNLLENTAEYLIFTDDAELYDYLKKFPKHWQSMSVEGFAKINRDGFFSCDILEFIIALLNREKFSKRVLDFDCFFGKSNFRTKCYLKVELDCIAENLYPIYENVYGKIYRAFEECKFHHFDALILSNERTPEEFIDVLIETDASTEKIFAFVRKNSALESWLAANQNIFAQVKVFKTANGAWCLIEKIMPPADVGVYVVTHKDAKLSALPEGYKFIHAGHALAKKDFGYAGDDTGENISRLNPFLDEVTALYWIWKNTSHTHTGFCHYRRFFTSNMTQKNFDAEKILSAEEILSLLRDYDIIVQNEGFTDRTQLETMILSTGQPDLVRVAERIVRSHLIRTQPDYLDAFDDVINGFIIFPAAVHVTRRNIFNAYCEWLFSFIIEATEEMRDKIEANGKSLGEMGHDYSRVAGFFCERLFTVWLMKNHLRIKELPIMHREDV
ncbi:MAG: DUF4422 domain-containing protein [Selenomonadaceae bacterium]|nr:DUF4422 domain-containing protein [Selenomonadaceae bacterium]